MRNTSVCPKCGSKDITRIEGRIGAYGMGNNILVGSSIIGAVKVTRFLCVDCGFSEEWVESKKDREKLKKRYGSVDHTLLADS